MDFKATIVKLTRYVAKGYPGEALESAMFLEGLGMEGDFHARGGERQLSLLSLQERQWMDAQAEPGLCFGRYKENILLDTLPALAPGTKVHVGEAVLEITETGKHCFEECRLYRRGTSAFGLGGRFSQGCMLAGRNLFAEVVKSGLVHIGDRVTI